MPADVEILYDGACPLCRQAVCLRDDTDQPFATVDARTASALRDAATAAGIDLDQGFVVRRDGQLYAGTEAAQVLAGVVGQSGWRNRLTRMFFGTRSRTRRLYPLFRAARRAALALTGKPLIRNIRVAEGTRQSTVQRQLGPAWEGLDPAIQRRFACDPKGDERIVYDGQMETVRCSRTGGLFARLTRVIGNPLTPYSGQDVPMTVTLSAAPGGGVRWQRTYHFAGRTPDTVASIKREDGQGQMLECVGGGFGMILRVSVEQGQLHFRSTRYFLSVLGYKLPLPHLLSPGETHVVHAQVTGETFRFTIRMLHPWLGETFYQTGLFRKAA